MLCTDRLKAIAAVIDGVELRCSAVDGPVTKTSDEITEGELRKIYRLTKVRPYTKKPAGKKR